ncbi:hypothetical protein COLO4_36558 [Corchorus olitorius]|uniref:Uncharacterized protein n=1 Tax=Corchorus olitorius TaxID=93759 RepID=A0A1R3G829_9ROSI|nr:hypothetical protein COLO4_36558 [Corchorus olitorius]
MADLHISRSSIRVDSWPKWKSMLRFNLQHDEEEPTSKNTQI